MHISEFDYELPPELIAQEPLERRDASRMLVLDRARESWVDSRFIALPEYLRHARFSRAIDRPTRSFRWPRGSAPGARN